jgi:F-type H+-transporting ATPase subunit gamma
VICIASTNEIRRHIAAVTQTKKITGAMQMVSSNRMRKVMGHIEHNRNYFAYIRKTMREILSSSHEISHPYLNEPKGRHKTFIVFSGDKGLCGSYNSSVLNLAWELYTAAEEHSIITVGNTAEEFFRSHGITPDIAMLGIVQDPTPARARALSRDILQLFDSGITDEIRLVFTSFYGASRNKPISFRLLPIVFHDYDDVPDAESLSEMMYLTTPQETFDSLIPQYVIGLVFGVMVQAYASEHFARMNAMQSSTENAQDMLKTLRTQYNLARQSAITNEISELSGAAEVLKPKK